MPDPSELTAAAVTAWAATWALTAIGLPAIPAIALGGIIWAGVIGTYRRRWNIPTPPAAPS